MRSFAGIPIWKVLKGQSGRSIITLLSSSYHYHYHHHRHHHCYNYHYLLLSLFLLLPVPILSFLLSLSLLLFLLSLVLLYCPCGYLRKALFEAHLTACICKVRKSWYCWWRQGYMFLLGHVVLHPGNLTAGTQDWGMKYYPVIWGLFISQYKDTLED